MKKMEIRHGIGKYGIYIDNGFSNLGKLLVERKACRTAIVTDDNVAPLYGAECAAVLEASGYSVDLFAIKSGEESKNLRTVESIYRFLASKKTDRGSLIAALGGGVVGDIAGFAAATYMRGIDFIQVPTTLLAQADSSIGGKTGVDFEGSKNIIGAFHQPRLVYINIKTLDTLPEREMKSGVAETIKHGLIADAEYFEYLEKNMARIYARDPGALMHIAEKNCEIKGHIVSMDEKEAGLRATLNLGHTFGHALETVSGFRLSHGECVAVGIIGAFLMANRLNIIGPDIVERVKKVIENAGLPSKVKDMDIEPVYNQMFMDKKARGGKLRFILPTGIGSVEIREIEDGKLIKSVLGYLFI
jgi:3-dehydroquinate synthase